MLESKRGENLDVSFTASHDLGLEIAIVEIRARRPLELPGSDKARWLWRLCCLPRVAIPRPDFRMYVGCKISIGVKHWLYLVSTFMRRPRFATEASVNRWDPLQHTKPAQLHSKFSLVSDLSTLCRSYGIHGPIRDLAIHCNESSGVLTSGRESKTLPTCRPMYHRKVVPRTVSSTLR